MEKFAYYSRFTKPNAMKYNKQNLQEQLNVLINEKIIGIFFHPIIDSENYSILSNNSIETYRSYGFFIRTKTEKWFTIYETDYSSNSGFTGLGIKSFELAEVQELDIGENQINTDHWKNYHHSKIESVEIYEDECSNKIFSGNIPVGVTLQFTDKKSLFILNITVESIDEKTKSLNFSRGGELLICFKEDKFKELGIGKLNHI